MGFLVSVTGCDKLLDVSPVDDIDSRFVYSSLDNFEKGVLGIYGSFTPENSILIGSIMADECKLSSQNRGIDAYGDLINKWEYTSADDILLQTWKKYYYTIFSINSLLENVDKVPVASNQQKSKLNSLVSELYALRALVHFELHRNFGNSDADDQDTGLTIPYTVDTHVDKMPNKITLANFYKMLWQDLDKSLNIENAVDFRLSKNAVHSLAARVALYQKDYSKAVWESTEVINAVPLSDADHFSEIWGDHYSSEVIFRVKRNNQDKIRPNFLWNDLSGGIKRFHASSKLVHQYGTGDVRSSSFFVIDGGEYNINKYPGNALGKNINDVKYFRVSEMYLIRAEANLNLGNIAQSLGDINQLRRNRISGVEPLGTVDIHTILRERFMELCYEGHRYFDLKRLKLPVQREKADVLEGERTRLGADDNAYILPVPYSEIAPLS
ncbi:MAG: RagB/SusD family nutrient uptake outer membrane protein [Bergeyella sp.]|nr:RagB/SusD family nutrient uptake outer membrane protein [Bergeyella sp.]